MSAAWWMAPLAAAALALALLWLVASGAGAIHYSLF